MNRRKLLTGAAAMSAFGALTNGAKAQWFGSSAPGVTQQGLAQRLDRTTIQAFGDSISSSSCGTWFPTETDISRLQAWTASTVIPANTQVASSGMVFYTTAGGTTGATAPTVAAPNDGGIAWTWNVPGAYKYLTGYLTWAEIFSQGRLSWDMSMGYAGVASGNFKGIVLAGGSGYVSPVATCTNGVTATVLSSGGVVTGVTINGVGFGGSTCTITDASGPGTGAVVQILLGATGTLGIPGQTSTHLISRLADAVSCPADIICVHIGTNDVNGGMSPSTTITNLKVIYESLMLAGKRIVAMPITPAMTLSTITRSTSALRINKWIRAYCRGETWANPVGFRAIRLADGSGFYADGTVQTSFAPIGGSGGAGAMTVDGLHPSHRGAYYQGYAIWQAVQGWVGSSPDKAAPSYSAIDGYDPLYNPSGNMLEGLPWQASTVYAPGALCCNSNQDTYSVISVTGNATSAASGGPVGGGTSIADGNVTWQYTGAKRGRSNFSGGATGTLVAATGVTISGPLATSYQLSRTAGTSTGTLTAAIENPWSNGQVGQRQSLTWSLGSGTATDSWNLLVANAANSFFGLLPADLGVTPVYLELELELSNLANFSGLVLQLQGDRFISQTGAAGIGAGWHLPASTGEMVAFPNAGRVVLRTQPTIIHSLNTTLTAWVKFYFDASGGAGSITSTVKLNEVTLRRAFVA